MHWAELIGMGHIWLAGLLSSEEVLALGTR